MGDVLLTAPVMCGALEANPDLQIDFVTKENYSGYFAGIERLNVISAFTDKKHKGVLGLMRLSSEIMKGVKPDLVIDLHEVIRSRVLRYFYALRRIPVYRINKGRNEKRAYIKVRKRNILKHTTERYRDVFKQAGIDAPLINFPFSLTPALHKPAATKIIKLGLAPFARHQAKSWPVEYIRKLMDLLIANIDIRFFFYGSKEDAVKLKELDFGKLKVINNAGVLTPGEEVKSISKLDIFLSMDSANMHLADLIGIPVISIWGGTHPDLGFRPLNQPDNHSVQTSETLPCRPCSVYGNKPCSLKESKYKCLHSISPEIVASKILSSIS